MEKPSTQPLIHPETRIGHVHLKVANIERSLGFYRDLLGFEITQWYGEDAVFLSAGGYHHHIGLNTWAGRNVPPAPRRAAPQAARRATRSRWSASNHGGSPAAAFCVTL